MDEFPDISTTEADLLFLRTQLGALPERRGAGVREQMFQALAEYYSGPGRFYHNLHHVAEVLRLLDSVGVRAQSHEAVCFAAWFHDAVYDTRGNDNEERSAELAAGWLAPGWPHETISRVRRLILATRKHEAGNLPHDDLLFLDADLSILGAPEEIYLQYSAAIRREYDWVSEDVYRRERKRILENFVARERLYFTDELRGRLEARARRNLLDEIRALGNAGHN